MEGEGSCFTLWLRAPPRDEPAHDLARGSVDRARHALAQLQSEQQPDDGDADAAALAGATVAIVTIPQAIGFALIVGIPVQAVLVTAIIGGVICAMFSSSHHLVFGPTNTISIILAGALVTVADVPLSPLQKVLVLGFLIGVVQIAAGFFKLGGLTHFISRTVINGCPSTVRMKYRSAVVNVAFGMTNAFVSV